MIRPGFQSVPDIRPLFNIGALFDVPCGIPVPGMYGETLINGGLAPATGIAGAGNTYKSTIMHYMMLSAAARITEVTETNMSTYDTEMNISMQRLESFSRRFPAFADRDLFRDQDWIVTDKTLAFANEYHTQLKEFLEEKTKAYAKKQIPTPFIDRHKQQISIIPPTFGEIDSFTEFETADTARIQDENELGEASGNTIHMRSGLAKTRFLMELPRLTAACNHYMLLTAHIGKEIQMASGPIPQAPTKKLHDLRNGDKIKGTTDKFFFLTSNCFQSVSSSPLINKDSKAPMFPKTPEEKDIQGNDLRAVVLRQLRGKFGQTGFHLTILVSQNEGVLPSLTEFYLLKEEKDYGLFGNAQNYALDLLPDVKLSRTVIRSKIDENPRLRRALNITAELCQAKYLWKEHLGDLLCTPKELYDDLKAMGYDWDQLLDTRGYWVPYNDQHPVPFLSFVDLLKMRAGKYFPYWMNEDKTRGDKFHKGLKSA